jgi:hypothetical protein
LRTRLVQSLVFDIEARSDADAIMIFTTGLLSGVTDDDLSKPVSGFVVAERVIALHADTLSP